MKCTRMMCNTRARMARSLSFLAAALPIIVALPALAAVSTDATWKTPDIDGKQVLAVYKGGGKVTVEQAIAWAKQWTGTGRRLHMFKSRDEMWNKAAASSAIRQIALAKAAELKVEEMPGWPIAEKCIEAKALMMLLTDETWAAYTPTKQDIEDFVKENPEMATPPRPTEGPDAKLVEPDFQMPLQNDWVTWQLRGRNHSQVYSPMMQEAEERYPVDCADYETKWLKAEPDDVLIKAGSYSFTDKDIKSLAEIAGKKLEWCAQVVRLGDSGDDYLSLGELAREKGYAKRPEFAEYLKKAKEEWLIAVMKDRMAEEAYSSYTPSEQEIKDYYDNEYKGIQDQLLKCDYIVCPIDYNDPQSNTQAKALAAEIIMKLHQGAKFEDMLKEYPQCRYQEASERSVRPGTSGGFESPAIAGVEAGGIALESAEDFSGHCVIRVLENTPPQKTPLEFCRGQIIHDLASEYKNKTSGDLDGSILKKYDYAVQKSVLAQLSRAKL
ncbi:MAG: hypothetical protein GX141_11095 [Armatimonadetes bacterium]|nr:hypothetical protein [Armatimonadota bacterium]